jgi:D-alanyl-D-alanine carboxypeptidase (penicillin-binding protein 5/6)
MAVAVTRGSSPHDSPPAPISIGVKGGDPVRRQGRVRRAWVVVALAMALVAVGPATWAVAVTGAPAPSAPSPPDLAPLGASAVLMDAASGRVLWEKSAHDRRPVASITKLMTMAITLDAISAGQAHWQDTVTVSPLAASTGGSTAFLDTGEQVPLRDLFIALAVMSANDASVALAEHVGGSVEHFVALMNQKAQELGMKDTVYRNPHGLDEEEHVSSAYDVALISRYLLVHHPEVLRYTSMWEYWFEHGGKRYWLTNTNRLLIDYPGVDGLKTGWTERAGYGISVTAKRGDTRLIAVVLGYPDTKTRNAEAARLLNYGFSHYVTVMVAPRGRRVAEVPVDAGLTRRVAAVPATDAAATVERGQEKTVAHTVQLQPLVPAPVRTGQRLGQIVLTAGGKEVGRVDLVAAADVPRAGLLTLFLRFLAGTWPFLRGGGETAALPARVARPCPQHRPSGRLLQPGPGAGGGASRPKVRRPGAARPPRTGEGDGARP